MAKLGNQRPPRSPNPPKADQGGTEIGKQVPGSETLQKGYRSGKFKEERTERSWKGQAKCPKGSGGNK